MVYTNQYQRLVAERRPSAVLKAQHVALETADAMKVRALEDAVVRCLHVSPALRPGLVGPTTARLANALDAAVPEGITRPRADGLEFLPTSALVGPWVSAIRAAQAMDRQLTTQQERLSQTRLKTAGRQR